MATLKPTTPLRTPNKGSLKPASPLLPETAPKTPFSRPQRR
ncbi:cupin [Schaalia odontolytica]|nr:cupin [Schaalia odontolytica]